MSSQIRPLDSRMRDLSTSIAALSKRSTANRPHSSTHERSRLQSSAAATSVALPEGIMMDVRKLNSSQIARWKQDEHCDSSNLANNEFNFFVERCAELERCVNKHRAELTDVHRRRSVELQQMTDFQRRSAEEEEVFVRQQQLKQLELEERIIELQSEVATRTAAENELEQALQASNAKIAEVTQTLSAHNELLARSKRLEAENVNLRLHIEALEKDGSQRRAELERELHARIALQQKLSRCTMQLAAHDKHAKAGEAARQQVIQQFQDELGNLMERAQVQRQHFEQCLQTERASASKTIQALKNELEIEKQQHNRACHAEGLLPALRDEVAAAHRGLREHAIDQEESDRRNDLHTSMLLQELEELRETHFQLQQAHARCVLRDKDMHILVRRLGQSEAQREAVLHRCESLQQQVDRAKYGESQRPTVSPTKESNPARKPAQNAAGERVAATVARIMQSLGADETTHFPMPAQNVAHAVQDARGQTTSLLSAIGCDFGGNGTEMYHCT